MREDIENSACVSSSIGMTVRQYFEPSLCKQLSTRTGVSWSTAAQASVLGRDIFLPTRRQAAHLHKLRPLPNAISLRLAAVKCSFQGCLPNRPSYDFCSRILCLHSPLLSRQHPIAPSLVLALLGLDHSLAARLQRTWGELLVCSE